MVAGGLRSSYCSLIASRVLRLAHRLQAASLWVKGRSQRPFGARLGGNKQSGLGGENSLLSYMRAANLSLGRAG